MATSFENLVKISSSKSLNPHIQSLFYNGLVYPSLGRNEWERHIRFPPGIEIPPPPQIPNGGLISSALAFDYADKIRDWTQKHGPSSHYTEAQLEAGFRSYRSLVHNVKPFRNTFADFDSFVTAFKHLTNLKHLILTTSNCYGFYSNKVSRGTDLIDTKSSMRPKLDSRKAQKFSLRQTLSVLPALFTALSKLETIEIHSLYWSVIATQFSKFPELNAFSHLKTLNLEIADNIENVEDEVHASRQVVLGRALKCAKQLEGLVLYFYRVDDDGAQKTPRESREQILWSRVLGDGTWPKLKALEIVEIDMDPTFVEFFSRHPQLRKLYIAEPWLIGKASWLRSLHEMREFLRHLVSFELEGTFHCNLGEFPNDEDWAEVMFEGEWKPLVMSKGIDKLEGYAHDRWSLQEHITYWFVKGGPSPFKKND